MEPYGRVAFFGLFMTVTHLLFAVATTAHILLAIRWEEQDLITEYGDAYLTYREQVPMILPLRRSRRDDALARPVLGA